MERWVRTCRRELLDRTLIWNQRHLLHALHEFECFYNGHRPHQGLANARPLHPLPTPIADPDQIARLRVRRRDRLGGILHEYQPAPSPAPMRYSANTTMSRGEPDFTAATLTRRMPRTNRICPPTPS